MVTLRVAAFAVVAAVTALSLGGEARAEDISAKKVQVKDNADPAKRKVQVQSTDAGVEFADANSPDLLGATVHVYSATDELCVSLPAGAEWQSKNGQWRYKNKQTKNQAQLRDGKLKVKIASGVSYTLADDGSQGTVNAQVRFGLGGRYCLHCATPTKDDAKQFLAKNCVATSCDTEPPSACTPATYCGDEIVNGAEECEMDSDCASGEVCTASCACAPPPPQCGDGDVEAGEDCELDSDCAVGESCTDQCFCVDSQCPDAVEWTGVSGLGSTSDLDVGTSGFSHDVDPSDGALLVLTLNDFSGAAPACGVATVAGVNPRGNNCRCSNDHRSVCDQPFVADQDDCGGAVCDCYLSPPEPLSAGGMPLCLVSRLSADVSGTWNVDTGSAELVVPERTRVHLGITSVEPCPTCVGDAVANDGLRDGVCSGGPSDGLDCDANGTDASFPAPGGGAHSYDCWPDFSYNITGNGIRSDHVRTTATSSLAAPALPCGFQSLLECHCLACSGDSSLPCTSDTDCSDVGAGTCTYTASASEPNNCSDLTCTPSVGGEGTCAAGPNSSYCDGYLRADGGGIIPCSDNSDCAFYPAGNCTITEPRKCFPDTISETGVASTSAPVLASAFCAPPTANAALNSTYAGLPGPVKARREGTTVFSCAGAPASTYPGCP